MRALIRIVVAAALLLTVATPALAGYGDGEGDGEVEGRAAQVWVSRDGSPGRDRPGSSRWTGCTFHSPLSEREAEELVHGRASNREIDIYFESPDPDAEFLVFICPYGLGGVFEEFGGWELDETPPVAVAERLADYALEEVWIPELVPATSPAGDASAPLLVNLDTWLWVDEWTDQTATASLVDFPAFWLQLTAVPTEIVYDPGDGQTVVSCDPGIEWTPGLESSDCISTYELLPEPGFYTIEADAYYTVQIVCPGDWCNAANIEARLNAQLATTPFESERDVLVEQVRGLVTE